MPPGPDRVWVRASRVEISGPLGIPAANTSIFFRWIEVPAFESHRATHPLEAMESTAARNPCSALGGNRTNGCEIARSAQPPTLCCWLFFLPDEIGRHKVRWMRTVLANAASPTWISATGPRPLRFPSPWAWAPRFIGAHLSSLTAWRGTRRAVVSRSYQITTHHLRPGEVRRPERRARKV